MRLHPSCRDSHTWAAQRIGRGAMKGTSQKAILHIVCRDLERGMVSTKDWTRLHARRIRSRVV